MILSWPEHLRDYVRAEIEQVPPEIREAMLWTRMAEKEPDVRNRPYCARRAWVELRDVFSNMSERDRNHLIERGLDHSGASPASPDEIIRVCRGIMNYYMCHVNTRKEHRTDVEIRRSVLDERLHKWFDLMSLVKYTPGIEISGKNLFWLEKASSEAKSVFNSLGLQYSEKWDSWNAERKYLVLCEALNLIEIEFMSPEKKPATDDCDRKPGNPIRTGFGMNSVLLLAAAWCAVLGTVSFYSDWVYQLSRWGVCASAVYGALGAKGAWRWPLWILAVIYNPIAPVHFEGDQWKVVNWLSSAVLAICATRTLALLTAFKK